nr:zinc finger protein 511 [Pogona vitticeps]
MFSKGSPPSRCWWGVGLKAPPREPLLRKGGCLSSASPRQDSTPRFSCHARGCHQAFHSLESYEHHYQALHRNVCSSCQRAFPSAHLLDVHLLEWHDSLFQVMAEKGDMYPCLVESCPGRFKGAKERKEHLVHVHQYPPDFRFNKPQPRKSSAKEKMPPSGESSVPMELNVEEPGDQVLADAMDVGPSESIPESVLPPRTKAALSCRYRIPPTICFGHGATRSFKGRREKH